MFITSLILLPGLQALKVSYTTEGNKRLLCGYPNLYVLCMYLPIGRSKLEEVHATAAAIERGEKCYNCY